MPAAFLLAISFAPSKTSYASPTEPGGCGRPIERGSSNLQGLCFPSRAPLTRAACLCFPDARQTERPQQQHRLSDVCILGGSWGASNPGQNGPPNELLFLKCFELLGEQKLFNSRARRVPLVGPCFVTVSTRPVPWISRGKSVSRVLCLLSFQPQ